MKWRVIVLLVILTVIHKVRSHNRRRQIRESFNRQSQVFVVTGGASGIGRHLTGCLLARGHKVVSCDINHEALQASYEESWKPTAGARIIIAKLDVRSPEQWAEALQLGVQTFGSLDVLLNIAGYIHPGAAAEFDLKQLDLHIDINTKVRTSLVLLSLESLTTLLTCVALSFSFLFFSFLFFTFLFFSLACVPCTGNDHWLSAGGATHAQTGKGSHCQHRLDRRHLFPLWSVSLWCQQGLPPTFSSSRHGTTKAFNFLFFFLLPPARDPRLHPHNGPRACRQRGRCHLFLP